MIAIIDYGMGNLRSVAKAFEKVGGDVQVTDDANVINRADSVVLPGVGAIKSAMDKLTELGLVPVIKESITDGKPFLGICLGFQLLFDKSEEGGDIGGLAVFEGSVKRFKQGKVPQIAWNQIQIKATQCPLFTGIEDNSFVYFCHSFYVDNKDSRLTAVTTDYNGVYTSGIWKNNVYGVQFHPEKSQTTGLKILENFARIKG